MALEMQSLISQHPDLVRHNMGIHIGIATGPAVAGVIGSQRFSYDVWGDTDNLASRLADDGKKGEIFADKITYNRLRQHYQFESPNLLNLKGKGNTVAYKVLGLIKGVVVQ